MALDFANSNANYLTHVGAFVSQTDPRPCSVSLLFKADSASAEPRHAFLNNAFTSNDPSLYLPIDRVSGTTYKQRLYSGGYVDGTDFTLDTNWNQYGWTWDTDDSVGFFFNGAANGTASKATGGSALADNAAIGALGPTGGFDIGGEIAEFGFWSAILDASEWAALGARYAPELVRVASLLSHLGGVRSNTVDRVGGDWVENGTVATTVHPRIIYPSSVQVGVTAGAPPAGNNLAWKLTANRPSLAGVGGGLVA